MPDGAQEIRDRLPFIHHRATSRVVVNGVGGREQGGDTMCGGVRDGKAERGIGRGR